MILKKKKEKIIEKDNSGKITIDGEEYWISFADFEVEQEFMKQRIKEFSSYTKGIDPYKLKDKDKNE